MIHRVLRSVNQRGHHSQLRPVTLTAIQPQHRLMILLVHRNQHQRVSLIRLPSLIRPAPRLRSQPVDQWKVAAMQVLLNRPALLLVNQPPLQRVNRSKPRLLLLRVFPSKILNQFRPALQSQIPHQLLSANRPVLQHPNQIARQRVILNRIR